MYSWSWAQVDKLIVCLHSFRYCRPWALKTIARPPPPSAWQALRVQRSRWISGPTWSRTWWRTWPTPSPQSTWERVLWKPSDTFARTSWVLLQYNYTWGKHYRLLPVLKVNSQFKIHIDFLKNVNIESLKAWRRLIRSVLKADHEVDIL